MVDGMPEGDANPSPQDSFANSSSWAWGPPDLVMEIPKFRPARWFE